MNVNANLCLCTPRRHMGKRSAVLRIPNLEISCRLVISNTVQMLYPRDKASCIHRRVGSGAGLDIWKTERPLALARYRPRFFGQPARSLVSIPTDIYMPHDVMSVKCSFLFWTHGKWSLEALSTFPVYSQPTVTPHSIPLWATSVSHTLLSLTKFIKWWSLTMFICVERVEDYRNKLQLVGYVQGLIRHTFHGLTVHFHCVFGTWRRVWHLQAKGPVA
jgi:hypothetical protein